MNQDNYSEEYYDYSDEEEQHVPEYASVKYWDKRYKVEKTNYDWYMNWSFFQPLLDKYVKDKEKLLVLGCGNSTLSAEIGENYFSKIISIDISKNVIENMKKQYHDKPKLEWEYMDCRKTTFENETFDVVIDKGTIDALCCSTNSLANVSNTSEDMFRILKPGGYFIVITFGTPCQRLVEINHTKHNWKTFLPIVVDQGYEDMRDSQIYIFVFQKNE